MYIAKDNPLFTEKGLEYTVSIPPLEFNKEELLNHELYFHRERLDKVIDKIGLSELLKIYKVCLTVPEETGHQILETLSDACRTGPEVGALEPNTVYEWTQDWERAFKQHHAREHAKNYFGIGKARGAGEDVNDLYRAVARGYDSIYTGPFNEGIRGLSKEERDDKYYKVDTFNLYLGVMAEMDKRLLKRNTNMIHISGVVNEYLLEWVGESLVNRPIVSEGRLRFL